MCNTKSYRCKWKILTFSQLKVLNRIEIIFSTMVFHVIAVGCAWPCNQLTIMSNGYQHYLHKISIATSQLLSLPDWPTIIVV